MGEEIFKKLPKKARYNMLVSDIISSVIIGIILMVVGIVISAINGVPPIAVTIYKGIVGLGILFMIGDLVLTQIISYKRIKYLITDSAVEIHKGLFFVDHTIIPIRRMQQINIEAGPINRRFQLANVQIITAGGEAEMEYIEEEEAEKIAQLLKDRINEFTKEYGEKNHG